MTVKNIYDIFYLVIKMISKIILEDVLDEMIENVCYAKLKSMVNYQKNKEKN